MIIRILHVACCFLFASTALAGSILPIEDSNKYILDPCDDVNFLLGIEGGHLPARVHIKVLDVSGKEIHTETFRPTVVADNKAFIHANLMIDSCRQSGWFHISAEEEDNQGKRQPLDSEVSFVILPQESGEGGFWGIADLWGLTAMTSRFNTDDAILLKRLGVPGVRYFVDWRSMRRTDDWGVVWKQMDSILEAAQHAGIDVLPVLVVAPEYAVKNVDGEEMDRARIPDDQSWRDFVRAVGERYRGRIKHWEIWNEANVKGFWNGSSEEYAVKLDAAYEILKKIDRANIIVSAGTSGVDVDWVKQLLSKTDRFDALAVHTYRSTPPEVGSVLARHYGGKSLDKDIQSLRAILSNDKPIWITETGLNTRKGGKRLFEPISELEQAAMLVRHAVIAKSQGVGRGYWWLLRDTMGLGTGLFRRQWSQVSPKPSLAAMAWVNRRLSKGTKVAMLPSEQGVFRYRLSQQDATWNVVWTLSKGSISVPCGKKFFVFDMVGGMHDIQSSTGMCELPLEEGMPIFWREE
jgi:hypothetical protein